MIKYLAPRAILAAIVLAFLLFLVPAFARAQDVPWYAALKEYGTLIDPIPIGWTDSISLAANTPKAYTMSATLQAKKPDAVLISSLDCGYVFKLGAAAAIPGDVTDGTASAANVSFVALRGATSIGFASPSACVVTISAFKVRQ